MLRRLARVPAHIGQRNAVGSLGVFVPMSAAVADSRGCLRNAETGGSPVDNFDVHRSCPTRPTGHGVKCFGRHAAEFLFQGCHPRFQPGVARQETPCQFDGLEPRAELHAGERTTAALDKLERAEQAADTARQKVLKRPVKA